MPRTRSTKKDDRTPTEKLAAIDNKIDRFIFFNYYDGYSTNGMLGFKVTDKIPPGSTKHRTGIFEVLTKNQFRSRGKRIAILARAFIEKGEVPQQDMRPQFTLQEIEALLEENEDKRTTEEKLREVTDVKERFIFFQYYDGYVTRGEIGFSENAGPPGTVNHKRAYANYFSDFSEAKFREKGRVLANLAKEFIAENIIPPNNLRPPPIERQLPRGLLHESKTCNY